ncbi:helix-turn-helix domain-containing protein [Roseomonas sp. OT10]|uniref:ArsR/SmtB family transcription factor n=1 Tax=Roseomonas cutis TaxID=2897332 RepID=UPI001E4AF326|nr:helix-turn-helix domain-containing protein [Roseomonas sp. OT10]UFN47095.1 helix-turn-helix domain-containing protein [Roseomonas sp. OT10]
MTSPAARTFLTVIPEANPEAVKGLASPVRLQILRLLRQQGPLNVNQIGERLSLPQSTVAANVLVLEETGLIETEVVKATKGQQKICRVRFDDIVIRLDGPAFEQRRDLVEVAMPLGLYTSCDVRAPCGLCSPRGVIGLLDVPDFFLDPARVEAALIWFSRGFVEYKFPNNAKLIGAAVRAVEFSLELSSEVPGTSLDWPSDITLWVNGVKLGTWTSPADYGDKRGTHTPRWWKLEGSQYGRLTTWQVTDQGTFFDGLRLSGVTLRDLDLDAHHSIRLRIGIEETAAHPGGINIFGRQFGNHDQDIVMRLRLA